MIRGLFGRRPPVSVGSLEVGGIPMELVRKRVKYLNVTVYPPDGRVRVCAPVRASGREIHTFVTERLTWIDRQRQQARRRAPAAPPRYETGELHLHRGRSCRLEVIESSGVRDAGVEHDAPNGILRLRAPKGSDRDALERIHHKWQREELSRLIPPVLARWEAVVGAEAHSWGVKKMRTKWGTCNTRTRKIWLSLELIKRSAECLDYIMVHELTHLLERGHGPRFKGLMDRFMPDWRDRRAALRERAGGGEDAWR